MFWTASILIPALPPQEEVELASRGLYEHWREEKLLAEPPAPIVNIRFEHDPAWRSRLWSIESARTLGHPVWVVVAWLFQLAAVGAYPAAFLLGQR